jgi:hypothetical protein
MKILNDTVSTLNIEPGVIDIRQGLFHIGGLTDKYGLAAILPRDAIQQEHPYVNEPGNLLEKNNSDIIRIACSDILENSISRR